MRKVLSLVLVLALVLGSVALAFAAPMSDVKGTKYEDSVNVLTELGVVTGYPDGSYQPAGIVTRAEMAVIVVRALGLADYAVGTANFKDMGGHWSNPYVAYANALGIIAGYPDGTFKPDNTVSYDEAATMLVAALGYTPDSLVGTWPANYVTKAKTLDILDGIKGGVAGANRGDIAIMAFQTLDCAIGKTNKDGDWIANVPADDMMGRLDAQLYDPDKGASPSTTDPGDAFVVTDTIAEEAVANIREYIGAYVTAYSNSDHEIIAIKEVKSTFLTGEFDNVLLTNIKEFETDDKTFDYVKPASPSTIEYFDNGVVTTAAGVGAAVTDDVAASTEYKIAADVSGVKIKDVYSVALWSVDDDFMFEDGDLEDDELAGNPFTLDDNDEIDYGSFALLGVGSLEDIEEDNVVYVYLGGTDITRIEVGTEIVKGEVSKINAAGTKVTVGGKAYELSSEANANASAWAGISVGDELEFYLDYNGKVFEIEEIDAAEGENYAMVLQVEDYKGGLASGNAMMAKLFLEDGTVETFEVDKDFNDSGSLTDGNGKWTGAFSSGVPTATMLVEYGLDKDGVIDYIELVAFHADSPGVATEELTSKGYYDGKTVASDAIIFSYDGGDLDDEDSYDIATVASAKGKEFAADYAIDSGKIVVMVATGLGSGSDEIYGIVVDRANVLESVSSTKYQVTMLVGDDDDVPYPILKSEYDKFAGAAPAYNYWTLYEISTNAKGEITALKDVTADGNSDTNFLIGGLTSYVKATDYANSVVTAGSAVTVDKDAFWYLFNADDEIYEAVKANKSNILNRFVKLIDLDNDNVADIVMINKVDATAAETAAADQAAVDAEAAGITAIPAIATDGSQAAGTPVLPAVSPGYTIAVKTTTDAAVYDLAGNVQSDGPVTVVFTVTHTASTKTSDTIPITFTVDVL